MGSIEPWLTQRATHAIVTARDSREARAVLLCLEGKGSDGDEERAAVPVININHLKLPLLQGRGEGGGEGGGGEGRRAEGHEGMDEGQTQEVAVQPSPRRHKLRVTFGLHAAMRRVGKGATLLATGRNTSNLGVRSAPWRTTTAASLLQDNVKLTCALITCS